MEELAPLLLGRLLKIHRQSARSVNNCTKDGCGLIFSATNKNN